MQTGDKLGRYEILTALPGEGTDESWRGRDTERHREVTIRALPASAAGDADRLASFGLQLQALAGLDHAHIARVYGIEQSEGGAFLVTEAVEGESLADRLRRGALPVEDALRLGLQIAEALEAAHEKGIAHRDLNPNNIHVAPDGQIKVLDFGLSGLLAADDRGASDPDLSDSPTLSVTASRSGAFSVSAAYLSPEQARGEAADTGADIWAFGCVLFEMLAGGPVFGGATESDVRAAVLKSDPDWDRLPAALDPRVRLLIEECLDKRPESRVSAMALVRADIGKILAEPADAAALSSAVRRRPVPVGMAAVVLAGVLGVAVAWGLRPDASAPNARFGMWASRPGGSTQALQAVSPELGISPDGGRIVFRGVDGQLYLRDRGDMISRPVRITEETEALHAPFFSPDGSELYFVDAPGGRGFGRGNALLVPRVANLGQIAEPGLDLKRVPVDGGAPTPVLTDRGEEVLDGSFTRDGTILFADSQGRIQEVAANGGTPTTLMEAPGARHPQLLPGGDEVLYSIGDIVVPMINSGPFPIGQIVVQSLTDPEDRRVVWEGGTQARYVEETGHIVYIGTTQPGLWAFPFDAGRLERTGDPVPIVEALIVDYALSENGSLAYAAIIGFDPVAGASGTGGAESILGLVNRNGAVVRSLRVQPGVYRSPRVSPDGSRVVYEFVDASGESHIWVYDLVQEFPQTLTDGGENTYPIWKDDTTVTYASNRGDGGWGVYSQPVDGSEEPALVVSAPEGTVYRPQAWSGDDTLVLVAAGENDDPRTGRLAMFTAGAGDETVVEVEPYEPGANEFGASLSPDGAWLAYVAECDSLYGCARVQRFPPVRGSSVEVSQRTPGTAWLQFSPDGTELVDSSPAAFFLWAVDGSGGSIDFTGPSRRGLDGFQMMLDRRSFDMRGPTGLEFVMVIPSDAPVVDAGGEGNNFNEYSSRIDYLHDFFEVLRERVRPSGG